MNEQSKRRIVGGVVVLVGIMIGAPFLFNNPLVLEELQTIPPAPQFTKIEVKRIAAPEQVQKIEEKLAEVKENRVRAADRVTQEVVREPTKGKPKETLDQIVFNDRGIPVRWVVQAASYSDKDNAERFRKRLTVDGFPVLMRQVKNAADNLFYVVYVGPVLRRSRAEEYKDKIDKTFNTQGIIKQWN